MESFRDKKICLNVDSLPARDPWSEIHYDYQQRLGWLRSDSEEIHWEIRRKKGNLQSLYPMLRLNQAGETVITQKLVPWPFAPLSRLL